MSVLQSSFNQIQVAWESVQYLTVNIKTSGKYVENDFKSCLFYWTEEVLQID